MVAAACLAAHLALSLGPGISEATGQHTLAVRVLNRGPTACVVDGYPRVRLSDARGAIPFVIRHGGDQMVTAAKPLPVPIPPGGAAYVLLNHYRCDVGVVRAARVVRVGGLSLAVTDPYRRPDYCGRGDPGSVLTVSPYEPSVRAALSGGRSLAIVSAHAIAGVRFGVTRSQAVAALSRLFGRPRRLVNSGCGPRYREVAWGHLYVEFRSGRMSGFRYMTGAWQQNGPTRKVVLPRLTTANGLTLGSTLGQVRAAYGRLDLIGTDRWQTPGGLVFYDNASHDPPPASSPVVEIKFGTCGDF